MEPVLSNIVAGLPLAAAAAEEEGGSFLVTPGLGLMIWTLLIFGVTFLILRKFAFPKIGEALDKRAATIRESIEAAEAQKEESDKMLAEYRQRLTEAREQADEIMAKARKTADTTTSEATAAGQLKREELVEAAKKDIEAETRRALDDLRKEVANLTILATEQVTRKSLDDAAHKELVEEALREVDFSALSGEGRNN
ncbi:MAG: F-type H+-transporting ATPase subunit b [Actinomycetota bacterium]|nr:F-type H+-transporting ATPase subunit b [Actinomycetota bacterium]